MRDPCQYGRALRQAHSTPHSAADPSAGDQVIAVSRPAHSLNKAASVVTILNIMNDYSGEAISTLNPLFKRKITGLSFASDGTLLITRLGELR